MADDENEAEGPVVELGEADPVAGVPIERVAARLHFGTEKSAVRRREGEATIRTSDGPRQLADVLAASDATYFDRREAFIEAVREVIGTGPVPTESESDPDSDSSPNPAADVDDGAVSEE